MLTVTVVRQSQPRLTEVFIWDNLSVKNKKKNPAFSYAWFWRINALNIEGSNRDCVTHKKPSYTNNAQKCDILTKKVAVDSTATIVEYSSAIITTTNEAFFHHNIVQQHKEDESSSF